jgi:hypothetical protein
VATAESQQVTRAFPPQILGAALGYIFFKNSPALSDKKYLGERPPTSSLFLPPHYDAAAFESLHSTAQVLTQYSVSLYGTFMDIKHSDGRQNQCL